MTFHGRGFTTKTKGFSLLEVLIVISILSILAAIGVFNYNAYARSVRMREVNNRVAQLFQETSTRAINRGKAYAITFTLNQTAGQDITITGEKTETVSLEADAEITSVKYAGGSNVTSLDFDARGNRTDPSTVVVSTKLGDLTGTVRLLVTGKTVLQ
jgi:prepilin-type N-terminal cleavage/methylation domain-containing protein